MRKAQLNVPGSGEEFSEVTFFHFGQGQGGGIQANVGRWFSQFQDAQTGQHEEKINGIRVVFVTAEGTFLSGTPGGPLTPIVWRCVRQNDRACCFGGISQQGFRCHGLRCCEFTDPINCRQLRSDGLGECVHVAISEWISPS
jgi:hypothetical protein